MKSKSFTNHSFFIYEDESWLKLVFVLSICIIMLTTVGEQSTIKVDNLKQPLANISNLVAGRVAGIVGVQRSGEPGYDHSEICIRGISKFTSVSPLILVDGVERSFNNSDPEDIASFSVLKDSSIN